MIKCIVIDDESPALQQMCSYVEKSPNLELVASFRDAINAVAFIEQNEIDLIFVDIEMPDLDGLSLVRSLTKPIKAIFTTAYRHYAVDGFAVDAADYLVKPISYAAFIKSINKVSERYFSSTNANSPKGDLEEYIFVKTSYKTIRVNLTEIKYIEANNEYIDIVTDSGERITTKATIRSMEESLPSSYFMRIHRSFIVNLNKVTEVERTRIIFNDEHIPIGNQYASQFNEFCNQKLIKK